MKTNKLIILLTAIALILLWGCEKDVLTSSDNELKVSVRAKGGTPGPPSGGGGDGGGQGGPVTLYQVTYHGDYFNSTTYAKKEKSNNQIDVLDQSFCGGFEMGHGEGLFCAPNDMVDCAMGTHITARKVNNPGNGEGLVAVVEYWCGDQHYPWRALSLERDWQENFNLFPAEGASKTYKFTNFRFHGGRFNCSPNGEVEARYFNENEVQKVTIKNLGRMNCAAAIALQGESPEWWCEWPEDPCP